jgi:hypothetical protein
MEIGLDTEFTSLEGSSVNKWTLSQEVVLQICLNLSNMLFEFLCQTLGWKESAVSWVIYDQMSEILVSQIN